MLNQGKVWLHMSPPVSSVNSGWKRTFQKASSITAARNTNGRALWNTVITAKTQRRQARLPDLVRSRNTAAPIIDARPITSPQRKVLDRKRSSMVCFPAGTGIARKTRSPRIIGAGRPSTKASHPG